MRKFIIRFLAAVIFFTISGLYVSAQVKYILEYKYKQGETYKYKHESRNTSVMEINGQEMKQVGSAFADMKLEVESVDPDSSIHILTFLEQMKVTQKKANRDTTIDLNEMLNKRTRVVFTKTGKILKNEMIDDIPTGNMMVEKNQGLVGINKEFAVFPGYGVTIGDRWSEEITDSLSSQMVTRIQALYTFTALENKYGHDCVRINYTGKTEITGKMKQMGMEFFIEGSGDVTGSFWFDFKSGIIISKETNSDQDLTLATTGQMQMTIPVTVHSAGAFTIKE